jgi:hypothetical protein
LGRTVSFIDASPTVAPLSHSGGGSVSVDRWPGYVAVAATATAVALLLWTPGTYGYAAGYILGAVVGPMMAVTHRFSFESRQKSPWFVRSLTPGRVLAAAVGSGLGVGVAHAWLLATELAKK